MATKKKATKATPIAEPSEQELLEAAREVVRRASGLSGSEFKKELSTALKKFEKSVLQAAERLVALGELHRWSSAKKVRFFVADPLELLPAAVTAALAQGPGTETQLAQRIDSKYRGLGDLAKEWLKKALARGEVFQLSPAPSSKTKRYSSEPDIADLLKKVIVELKKIAESPAGRRVAPARFIELLAQQFGVAVVVPKCVLLDALTEFSHGQPRGALLSVRDFRPRVALTKEAFDSAALELASEGRITLHYHDYPSSLSEEERDQLIVDQRGTHYVGIALVGAP